MASEKESGELQRFLETAPDTELVEILAPDMNGILRGKRISPDDFGKAFGSGINYCASSAVMDTKGEAFEG